MTVWLVWTGDVPIQVWLLCVLLPVGMMFCLLYFTIDISEKMVLYCCMKAFLSAEFMASLEWQLEYFVHNGREKRDFLNWIILILVYGAVAGIYWVIDKRMKRGDTELEVGNKELFSTLLIVACAYTISNLSLYIRTRRSAERSCRIYLPFVRYRTVPVLQFYMHIKV